MSETSRICQRTCPVCPIEVVKEHQGEITADGARRIVNETAAAHGADILAGTVTPDQISEVVIEGMKATGDFRDGELKTDAAIRALEYIVAGACIEYGPEDLVRIN